MKYFWAFVAMFASNMVHEAIKRTGLLQQPCGLTVYGAIVLTIGACVVGVLWFSDHDRLTDATSEIVALKARLAQAEASASVLRRILFAQKPQASLEGDGKREAGEL